VTAAEDRREDLEAILWRLGHAPEIVTEVMRAARAYARAAVRDSREPKAPAAEKVPVVHLASVRGRSACRPHDPPAFGWKTAGAAGDVTCQHCRKTPAWRDAAGAQ
jgi:hypothetical protein